MKEITVKELKAKRDNGDDFQLIDIREDWEVDCASIGGMHIPMGEVLTQLGLISKEIPVIIHCKSGSRSDKMVQYLEQNYQFENLYSLQGGIVAWAEEIDSSLKVE